MMFGIWLMALGVYIIWFPVKKPEVKTTTSFNIKESKVNIVKPSVPLKVKSTRADLVRDVLQWCEVNIHKNTVKYKLKIDYSSNSKYYGKYMFGSRTIVIYINEHKSKLHLVETAIHEFIHHSFHRNKQIQYSRLLTKFGYDNHPQEIESRSIANANKNRCLEFLEKTKVYS